MAAFAVNLVGTGWQKSKRFSGSRLNNAIKIDVDKTLRGVGGYLADQLRRNIASRGTMAGKPFVPNSPVTIKIKKHDKPLIGKGDMVRSITYQQIGTLRFMVGIFDPKLAERGAFHEKGGITTIKGRQVMVPARPWMEPVLVHQGVRKTSKTIFAAGMARLGHKIREAKL